MRIIACAQHGVKFRAWCAVCEFVKDKGGAIRELTGNPFRFSERNAVDFALCNENISAFEEYVRSVRPDADYIPLPGLQEQKTAALNEFDVAWNALSQIELRPLDPLKAAPSAQLLWPPEQDPKIKYHRFNMSTAHYCGGSIYSQTRNFRQKGILAEDQVEKLKGLLRDAHAWMFIDGKVSRGVDQLRAQIEETLK